MIRPLHSLIHARPLKAEAKLGSFVLPDAYVPEVNDAEVLAVGPGRQLRSGGLLVPQAQVQDRVVFEPHAVRTWLADGTLLVDDRDLVAVIPGIDWCHQTMHPANDYVFVQPDPVPTQSAGGIAIAHHTARSADAREKSRRNQLVRDFQALRQRWVINGEPLDEQRRLGIRWAQGLSPADKLLAADALQAGDLDAAIVDDKHFIAPIRKPRMNTGQLLDLGPGAVLPNGERRDLTVLLAEAIETGRCAWKKEHNAVQLYFGGESLLALRAEYLLAGVE